MYTGRFRFTRYGVYHYIYYICIEFEKKILCKQKIRANFYFMMKELAAKHVKYTIRTDKVR